MAELKSPRSRFETRSLRPVDAAEQAHHVVGQRWAGEGTAQCSADRIRRPWAANHLIGLAFGREVKRGHDRPTITLRQSFRKKVECDRLDIDVT